MSKSRIKQLNNIYKTAIPNTNVWNSGSYLKLKMSNYFINKIKDSYTKSIFVKNKQPIFFVKQKEFLRTNFNLKNKPNSLQSNKLLINSYTKNIWTLKYLTKKKIFYKQNTNYKWFKNV